MIAYTYHMIGDLLGEHSWPELRELLLKRSEDNGKTIRLSLDFLDLTNSELNQWEQEVCYSHFFETISMNKRFSKEVFIETETVIQQVSSDIDILRDHMLNLIQIRLMYSGSYQKPSNYLEIINKINQFKTNDLYNLMIKVTTAHAKEISLIMRDV